MIQTLENGRKEDGNRSIADKILKRLNELERTASSNYGRWAWELLQNAKDSIVEDDRKLLVGLVINEKEVSFSHNGSHFTEYDVRGLINQITSKEVVGVEVTKKVGRFGTGFISTHLLSRLINVKGVLKDETQLYHRFDFDLDRRGNNMTELAENIEQTWVNFNNSYETIANYDKNQCNTVFTYPLENDYQRKIAQQGVVEFMKLVPYVLAFLPVIESIVIIENGQTIHYQRQAEMIDDFFVLVKRTEKGITENLHIAIVEENGVTLAAPINPETRTALSMEGLPHLFCDFPLIGSHNFHFPVIINSPLFHPLTERGGIWLKSEKPDDEQVGLNQHLITQAVPAYEKMLTRFSEMEIKDLWNVVNQKIPEISEQIFDLEWYGPNVRDKIIEIRENIPIVDTKKGRKTLNELITPHHDKEKVAEEMWRLLDVFPTIIAWNKEGFLPILKDLLFWAKIYHSRLGICTIHGIEKYKAIATLSTALNISTSEAFKWLNRWYSILYEYPMYEHDNKHKIVNIWAIVPNKKGEFKKIHGTNQQGAVTERLYNDDVNDDDLLEILALLYEPAGVDWRDDLIHEKVEYRFSDYSRTKTECARFIYAILKEQKNVENNLKAVILLVEWFDANPKEGAEHFPELYRKRADLFVNTIEDKESLYRVMKSSVPLRQISEIAQAIENDPEILNIIRNRQQTIQAEKERNEIGEQVEQLLATVLQGYGFSVRKQVVGSDLIIELNRNGRKIQVEVKSTTRISSWVGMTPTQAQIAVNDPANYVLCVVYKNGSPLMADYVRQNAMFVTNIGTLLQNKVLEVNRLKNTQNTLQTQNEDIDISFETALDYRFRVSHKIWGNGKNMLGFMEKIKS